MNGAIVASREVPPSCGLRFRKRIKANGEQGVARKDGSPCPAHQYKRSDESFFGSAVADCASSKQTLSSFTADERCGAGSSSSATYSCCPTPPNEPIGGALQDANGACDTDASLFASAEADCTDAKASVVVFTPNESCGKGSSSGATYACN